MKQNRRGKLCAKDFRVKTYKYSKREEDDWFFFKGCNVVKNKIKSFMSNLCELSFIELAWLYSHSCAQFARTWTILVRNFSVKLQFYFTCEITKLPWQPKALSQSNCRNFSCSSISAKFNHDICIFILLQEKFLQFDWLRAVVFQLNFKYLHVKIRNLCG